MQDAVPLSPALQMALDQAVSEAVARGARPPLLRIWRWGAPAVVIGEFQSLDAQCDEDAARREGMTVVRRCTGGGAMFVKPEDTITLSLYAPLSFVAGLATEDAYALCFQWLVGALRRMGVPARFEPVNDIASPWGKIGGGASRRFPALEGEPGCFLHHATLAFRLDGAAMERVLRVSQEKLKGRAVASASKRVSPMTAALQAAGRRMTRQEAADTLEADALATIPRAVSDTIDEETWRRARELCETVYSTERWTRRIA